MNVLNKISFSFNANQTTAIIGRSGCGKSTMLRTINGLVKPDSGMVDVFGKPLDYLNLPRFREKIGYAVQGIGLFPHISIKENISLLARLREKTDLEIEKRLSEVCERTQLNPSFLERMPSQLSGGQQQRVGLARAIFMNPDIILLDEPFGALDPLTRIDVHHQFKDLKSTLNKTIIIVTHDMQEALDLADQIIIMDKGTIKEVIATKDIQDQLGSKTPNEFLLERIS